MKNDIGILMGSSLKPQITFGSKSIFIILILLIMNMGDNSIYWCLLQFLSLRFHSFNCSLCYFFEGIGNGIFFLTSFSVCSLLV
jgi:hypothetical protein